MPTPPKVITMTPPTVNGMQRKVASLREREVSMAATTGDGLAPHLLDFLKPFHDRASLAEDLLAKLEADLRTGKASIDTSDLLSSLVDLREKMEKAKAEISAEREQVI